MRVWRVVIAKYATLAELQSKYDICDLYDFHDAIDLEMEMQQNAREEAERNR